MTRTEIEALWRSRKSRRLLPWEEFIDQLREARAITRTQHRLMRTRRPNGP